jgi:hypothetical protein
LKAILLTQVVKAVEKFLKQLGKVSALVLLDKEVESVDFYPDYRCVAHFVGGEFLSTFSTRADDTGNENVDNTFKFLELLNPPVLSDELDLTTDLVLIGVVDPEAHVADHNKRHPGQLESRRFLLSVYCDYRKSDLQEGDAGNHAYDRDEEE